MILAIVAWALAGPVSVFGDDVVLNAANEVPQTDTVSTPDPDRPSDPGHPSDPDRPSDKVPIRHLDKSEQNDADAMDEEPIQPIGPGLQPPASLAPLIELARQSKLQFETKINAYTCLIVKQETIDGVLEPAQYLRLKVRDRRIENEKLVQPLSIYAKFLKPDNVAGREVLYVENRLEGDLLVRRGGTRLPNLTLQLDPEGRLARKDTNYSIKQTGIRPMLEQILSRMESQTDESALQIRLFADAKVDGRPCRHIEIRQLRRQPDSDYQIAKVYIDDEWNLPVYFASYSWAETEGDAPVLQEQYVITKIDLNANLSDVDFDRENPTYQFKKEQRAADGDNR